MYQFRLQGIELNTDAGSLVLPPKSVTIFVGPNNSGKSRILKELRDALTGDTSKANIVKTLEFGLPNSFEELDETYAINQRMIEDGYGNPMLRAYINKPEQGLTMGSSLESYHSRHFRPISPNWKRDFKMIIENKDRAAFLDAFGALFFQYMGTEERLTICKTQQDYGLVSNTTNFLTSFKFRKDILDALSWQTRALFGCDIILDDKTGGNSLTFRVGDNFDSLRNSAINTEREAQLLYQQDLLDDQGDGLKSFVSTFLALKHNSNGVLLIDEPEAFLHPPLARQLGEIIGESSGASHPTFIATHSIDVLKGILSKCTDVNIVRVTRPRQNSNGLSLLPQATLRKILDTPLLRVSRVLEGVFCETVILTEAEADELVYQEFIEKVSPQSGLHFAHGQNKQTLGDIAQLYREMGINYEIATDFDMLRNIDEFSKTLAAIGVEQKARERLVAFAKTVRKTVNDCAIENGAAEEDRQKDFRNDIYHKQGIRFFDDTMKQQIENVLDELEKQHLHILPTGELETLLEDYGLEYSSNKKAWVSAAIEAIEGLDVNTIKTECAAYRFATKIIPQKPEA